MPPMTAHRCGFGPDASKSRTLPDRVRRPEPRKPSRWSMAMKTAIDLCDAPKRSSLCRYVGASASHRLIAGDDGSTMKVSAAGSHPERARKPLFRLRSAKTKTRTFDIDWDISSMPSTRSHRLRRQSTRSSRWSFASILGAGRSGIVDRCARHLMHEKLVPTETPASVAAFTAIDGEGCRPSGTAFDITSRSPT